MRSRKAPFPKIAGAGICCLDHILTAPQIPWGTSAHVEKYHIQAGGLVATALMACARLGAECQLFSYLGDDEAGNRVAIGLAEEGVSLSGVTRSCGGSTPFSFVHVDGRTGERTIFHRKASGIERRELPDLDWIATCDALVIDDYYPRLAQAAARVAAGKGIPVVADLTTNPRKHVDFFRNVSVLIVPREFAAQIGFADNLPGALDAMHWLGPKTALITLGAKGWMCSTQGHKTRGKAFKVEVVDTTGAGDAFHGAFAYGLARKWNTERCAEFAASVAAIKCSRPRGAAGLPSISEAVYFLKRNGRLDWSGYDLHGNGPG
jgi:sulfofructose kinase